MHADMPALRSLSAFCVEYSMLQLMHKMLCGRAVAFLASLPSCRPCGYLLPRGSLP
jgi:hypothetical protein